MSDQFIWAIKNGDLDKVKSIVEEQGKDIVQSELLNGRMALHYAADYGQLATIEYLLSMGADINLPDKHGITPLLAAIYENHRECVELLLNKGASTSGEAPNGSSYYDCAETDDIKALLK